MGFNFLKGGGIDDTHATPVQWVSHGWVPNYEQFSMTFLYEHYIWGLWRRLSNPDEELPSPRMVLLYVWVFLKSLASELYAFVTSDTCDGTFAAVFLGAFCIYLLLTRRSNELHNRDAAEQRKGPPIKVSPALAGQDFWEKYDSARGWKSNIACTHKSSQLTGGRNPKSRPLDVLLPRREYVPKRRVWEGSGTAHEEGSPAPLLKAAQGVVCNEASPVQGSSGSVNEGLSGTNAEHGENDKEQQTIDWDLTRQLAMAAAEVWAEDLPYNDWIQAYGKNFKTTGSLAATGILLDPLGPRHGLLEVNRQFFRDVTSGGMVQLCGHLVPSREVMEAVVEAEKKRRRRARMPGTALSSKHEHYVARFAWHGLFRSAWSDVALAHEVSSFANQNLGIMCYEYLVRHYSGQGQDKAGSEDECGELAVLQTGEHSVNIFQEDCDDGGSVLTVRFEGLFKLVPMALLDMATDELDSSLVRAVAACGEVRLGRKMEGTELLETGSVRFDIRQPVKLRLGIERDLIEQKEKAAHSRQAAQTVRVREWLASMLGDQGTDASPIGARVRIHGMAKISPGLAHFDSRQGTVISQDKDRDRFGVEVDDYGGTISFARQNLEFVAGGEASGLDESGTLAVAISGENGDAHPADASAQPTPSQGVRDGGVPVWTAGKERLMLRLMAEGFSRNASLRAILVRSASTESGCDDGGGKEAKNDDQQERQGDSGCGEGISKSTSLLIDCITWLCERLGEAGVNDDLSDDELEKLKLTKVDLDRLATKTCAENDASFPPVEPVGSAFCLPEQEVHEIFAALDRNGDGVISHAEFIRGLRENAQLASKLGMPSHIRAEDGTRTAYQLAFGMMDTDDSKTINVDELLEFCGQGRNVSSKASAASAAATPATSCTGVRIGARVRIHGMAQISSGLAHFDERQGTVRSQDKNDNRFGVEVDHYGGVIVFAGQNLEVVVPEPPRSADPWKVLEKASEVAAEAAAKKAREQELEKRRARAQERGFNKGYKS